MQQVRSRRIAVLLAAGALSTALTATVGVAPAGATNIGTEGCTPGYWKNHTENWQEYRPTARLGRLFTLPPELAKNSDVTMLQALQGGGGPGLDGAAKILFRAAAAAYLNAAHEGVGYPYRRFKEPFDISAQVNAALASLDRDTMLDLATTLDNANNLGCPLS